MPCLRRRGEIFSPAEERANTLSAVAGVLLSIVALIAMIVEVAGRGPLHMASAVVYGVSLIVLYGASAINHGLSLGPKKDLFHNLDLAAIYVLIAGTYTPITLLALDDRTGKALFVTIWVMAIVGCGRKLLVPQDFETGVDKISIVSYVVMGWLIFVAPVEFLAAFPPAGIAWVVAGGVAYSVGILFFRMTRLRHHHLIWHLFVMTGSGCHLVAIYRYVLPGA